MQAGGKWRKPAQWNPSLSNSERKRQFSKKSTQKRNQKRAEIKAKAEAGDPIAMEEYEAILEKGRQNNRKRAEKMRELRMADPEYRAKMEEKERLALEREKKRQERATKKKKIALAELKEQMEALRARAEAGDQEAQSQLAERKQYQVRATVKSYRKMREDALNGEPIAKERYEKTLAMRREAYHSKKSEQTA